jgi:hypothetical protein
MNNHTFQHIRSDNDNFSHAPAHSNDSFLHNRI